ncbi:hypothetical protein [Dactylosporangium matsuzakiense]|nr:hypothetical protein [Dactylosporangium matsuzakiense]UWZ48344.1 hypothetical protein Dmats_19200 [Dactylosporangium matsuzakiense]
MSPMQRARWSGAVVALVGALALVAVAAAPGAAAAGAGGVVGAEPSATDVVVPGPSESVEPDGGVCAVAPTEGPTVLPTAPTAFPAVPGEPSYTTAVPDGSGIGADPIAYRLAAAVTIDVTWVPLSSLFKTKTKPKVGDTLRFEADITIPNKMKDLVLDLVTKCAGGKKIGKIIVTCKVTAVDDGNDAITVTCQPDTITVEIDGKKTPIKFPATTPPITVGIAIVE